jgi:uncharacterized protein YeaO (DUF488 family)
LQSLNEEERAMATIRVSQRRTTGETRAAHGDGSEGAVRLKRAYEEPRADDGFRVLVDRLWPRGVSREALAIDAWMKEIGPSDELRRWFGHDAARWKEFAARYRAELRLPEAARLVDELVAQAKRAPITLVYGAKDELHNQAVVLRDVIERRLRRAPARRAA